MSLCLNSKYTQAFSLFFIIKINLLFGIELVSASCDANRVVPNLSYKIVAEYPHNTSSFTQGFLIEGDVAYESTGLRGKSELQAYYYNNGKMIRNHKLPKHLFGEGLAVVGERLIQLTYKAGKGLVYDKKTFTLLKGFSYPTEGWGLTYDGQYLIMSNGSATLFYLDPTNYHLVKKIEILNQGQPLRLLNELEYIEGKIYANLWQDNRVAVIDPVAKCNTAWLDFSPLLEKLDRSKPVDVLNGIAYKKDDGHLLITGKWWPVIFEVKLLDK